MSSAIMQRGSVPMKSKPTGMINSMTKPTTTTTTVVSNTVSKKRVNITVTIVSIDGLFVKDGAAKKKGVLSKKFSSRGNSNTNNSDATTPKSSSTKNANLESSIHSELTSSCSSRETRVVSNMKTQQRSVESGGIEATTTNIVASFSRVVKTKEGKHKTIMTHVPSGPLPLLDATTSSSGSGNYNGNGSLVSKKKTMNSVIHWDSSDNIISGAKNNKQPTNTSSGGRNNMLSSYKFQRTFQQDDDSNNNTSTTTTGNNNSSQPQQQSKFVPQPLAIQIAISRSGRMFKLGTAHTQLAPGEVKKNGESFMMNIPITNCNPAIPKSNKKFKVGGVPSTNNNNNKDKKSMIPMMKLKGDTLKCGLDQNATLRVMVHVSEAIGETVEISPKYTVTMVPSSGPPSLRWQKKGNEAATAAEAVVTTNNDIPLGNSWKYNPTLAAVIVKSQATDSNDDNGPLVRVQDEEYDDPSCSSSAYMSVTMNDDHHRNHRYPSKSKHHHDLSVTRSYSTSTTSTTCSSVVSDLTDGHSWLSQTGIEVIPFAPNNAKKLMLDSVRLPLNSRLRRMEENYNDVEEEEKYSKPIMADNSSRYSPTSMTIGQASAMTSIFPHSGPTKKKKSWWHQKLVCAGLPICGASSYKDIEQYDCDASLSAVNEEDDDNMLSNNRYTRLVGRCEGAMDDSQQESMSYYTEEDGSLFVDEDDDEYSSTSESSSESF